MSVGTVVVKAWGGGGGSRRFPKAGMITASTVLKQIVIHHHRGAIASFQCFYEDADADSAPWGIPHGHVHKIDLEAGEWLSSMKGTYDHVDGHLVVTSLAFTTRSRNKKEKHGPFGQVRGTTFSLPVLSGKIVGFHGRSGRYLDAIGVFLAPNHGDAGPR